MQSRRVRIRICGSLMDPTPQSRGVSMSIRKGGGRVQGYRARPRDVFSPRKGKGTRVHLGLGGDLPPLIVMELSGFWKHC